MTPMEMIQAAVARGWEYHCGAPVLFAAELRALSDGDLGTVSGILLDLGIGDNILLVADRLGLLLPPGASVCDDLAPGDRVCEAWPFGAAYIEFSHDVDDFDTPPVEFHLADAGYWSGEPVFC